MCLYCAQIRMESHWKKLRTLHFPPNVTTYHTQTVKHHTGDKIYEPSKSVINQDFLSLNTFKVIFYGLSGTPPGTALGKKRSGKKRSGLSQAPQKYQMNGSSPFGDVFRHPTTAFKFKTKTICSIIKRTLGKMLKIRRSCGKFERQSTGLMFAHWRVEFANE